MDEYKYFLSGVRNVSTQTVYIVINNLTAISPRLLDCVKFLTKLKYEDGKYHTYFGEVKRLVGSFFAFWTETMDETIKEGDRLANADMDKAALVKFVIRTINIRNCMTKAFDDRFLPITTPEQQQIYDELQKKHDIYVAGLNEMKATAEKFDKQEYVDEFVKTEITKSINMENNVFLYAHTYISMLLADHLAEIRGSLLDILQQSRRNLKTLQEEKDESLESMLNLLYDKNKQLMMLTRKDLHASVEVAELRLEIEKIRKHVIEARNRVPIVQLQNKIIYFETALLEFGQITSTLLKVKAEFEHVQREQALYQSRNTTELPGSKFECWRNMGQQYEERSANVKENLIKAAKALMTFFCVRGPNRAMYRDNIGPYHIDEFGHNVYYFESGLKMYHLDCNGNFKETKDEHHCYYDNNGRYFHDKGEKVYQILDCTSSYQMGEDTLMKKITVDCGHSEVPNMDCNMMIRDPTDVEILPKKEPVDITRTLDSEAARYLWASLGAVLPDALHDVGVLRPRNPIHYLAHRLLAHKYGKTKTELRQKKEEADAYRDKILKERKEKAASKTRAWRSTQAPRSRPADVDDADDRVAYDLYRTTNELICSINFYD